MQPTTPILRGIIEDAGYATFSFSNGDVAERLGFRFDTGAPHAIASLIETADNELSLALVLKALKNAEICGAGRRPVLYFSDHAYTGFEASQHHLGLRIDAQTRLKAVG